MNGETATFAGVLPRQYAPDDPDDYNVLIGRQTSWIAIKDMLREGILPVGLVIRCEKLYYDVVDCGMVLRGEVYQQSLARNVMGVRVRA